MSDGTGLAALAGGQAIESLAPQKSSGSSFGSNYGVGSSYMTGGASQTGSTTSPYGQQAAAAGQGILSGVAPTTADYQSMIQSALTGGGLSGVGIPMAQAAISQARGAAGANLASADSFLARSGTANSPFAAQLQSSIAAQGNEATAQAPVGIYQQLLNQIPGFISSQQGAGLSGLATGAASNYSNATQSQVAQNTLDYSHTTSRSYDKSKSGGFGF